VLLTSIRASGAVIEKSTTRKGAATMNLATTTQVSVDGVMQGPGGPEEDEGGVFKRRGWAHFDDEAGTVMNEIFQRADALSGQHCA
jgi:hypothetical protein